MREWYHDRDRDDHLPPGLAKRDRLPPGLERQLRVRGTLPPGLRKKMMPCPEEVERRLPPPPRGCAHVVIGGHVVLVNQSTYVVLDIVHFEL
jgi:Ni/Co efflux regulator RcnB